MAQSPSDNDNVAGLVNDTNLKNAANFNDFNDIATLDSQSSLKDLNSLADTLSETLFDSFDHGYYIGMMSGTSLDGMDAVIAQFKEASDNATHDPADSAQKIVATHSKDFPPTLRQVLLALCQPNQTASLAEIKLAVDDEDQPQSELDWFGWASREYAEFASDVVNELLSKANIDPEAILAIGCHGQTVRHRPQLGFTLQLVDANIIAERTGISVVTDFRRRDMAVGGQGAPLVPAFHQACFGSAANTRVLLNLGGIANLTYLPAIGESQAVIGYDTGPANLLLDAWAQEHTGKVFDAGGDWARSGQVVEPLLTQLLTHEFFSMAAPKSTGREDFNLAWLHEQIAKFETQYPDIRYSVADVQATLTELTALSASQEIIACVTKSHHSTNNNNGDKVDVYVCGGGSLNNYLMQRLELHLSQRLHHCTVVSTNSLGIAPTWVESMAFAWLARQTLMGETGNLPAVTGASKPVVLGQVCFG